VKAVILHDRVTAAARADESDVLVQAAAVSEALFQLGIEPVRLEFDLNLSRAAEYLRRVEPAFVFNLVESVEGQGSLIHLAPALLDNLGIPYTGAGTDAMFTTSNKVLAKRILHSSGIPTPEWVQAGLVARVSQSSQSTKWIVKPVWEHASVGLDDSSVFQPTSDHDLARRREQVQAKLAAPCFAEVYIEGREFNLSLLDGGDGPETVAAAEMLFLAYEEDKPRIVGYPAKWDTHSFEYQHTQRTFESSPGDSDLVPLLERMALDCWQLFDLRGYARVDFRVDQDWQPWVLEINVNPCLSPDAGFSAALLQAGIGFPEAIRRIVNAGRSQKLFSASGWTDTNDIQKRSSAV
jgi:D-alanine-D-alanine ligase